MKLASEEILAERDEDSRVGYGRPPKHSQFKKGQSGNPKGRPKRKKSLQEMIREAFEEPVKVRGEDGRVFSMPKIKAAATQLANAAAKGDGKALRLMVEMLESFGPAMIGPPPDVHIHFVDPPKYPESPGAGDSNVQTIAQGEEEPF